MANRQEVVAGWWRYHQMTGGNRQERLASDEWYWAWEEVSSMVEKHPVDAIEVLVELAEAAPSSAELGAVGAGPIEDLIYWHHAVLGSPGGRPLVEALGEASRRSPSFRQALGSVWYDSDEVPDNVRDQIPGFPPPLNSQS